VGLLLAGLFDAAADEGSFLGSLFGCFLQGFLLLLEVRGI
jgi:hypothetical protein